MTRALIPAIGTPVVLLIPALTSTARPLRLPGVVTNHRGTGLLDIRVFASNYSDLYRDDWFACGVHSEHDPRRQTGEAFWEFVHEPSYAEIG